MDAHAEAPEPVLLNPTTRDAGRRLASALLAFTDEVHLPSGRHAKSPPS